MSDLSGNLYRADVPTRWRREAGLVLALLFWLPADLLLLHSAYRERHWWLTAAGLAAFAGLGFGLWQSRRWGNAVALESDRIRLFRGDKPTFVLPYAALQNLELNWSGLVLKWRSHGHQRTIVVPADEFTSDAWKALTESLRELAGQRLRDTRFAHR